MSVQPSLQSVSVPGQGLQTPPTQMLVAPQPLPQPPQLLGSVPVSLQALSQGICVPGQA
jgi:hypothetical protein